ncbi:hypothetical protein C4D60_Mb07t14700 [Musa balbisiana]|uniref:Uncharacterized protein n=1 Tax=Musa balbisiana TaxID=52838 RepID=A0A4S8JFK0_MUSBA|nr:hypothetical protein C4D60_Mb07t14700 [Musa balbisiana]
MGGMYRSDRLPGLRNIRSQLYSAAEYFELSYMNDDGKEIATVLGTPEYTARYTWVYRSVYRTVPVPSLDRNTGFEDIRSQLYSAAEYFELSYMNDDGKEMVMRSLKDYAVKAIANAVDHLGSVSYKVDNLLNSEVDEVSVATFEVSCIEQRLRMCQTHIDHEGLSQQSLLIKPPKYHKHNILQGKIPFLIHRIQLQCIRQSTADSGKLSMLKCQGFYPPKENSKLNQHQTGARSAASRPNIPNSSKKYIMETQNSLPICLHAERNNHSETERNPTRKRRFLNALIMRNRSWTDESLYSFLNEY